MEQNYWLLRRVYNSICSLIAKNLVIYLCSLSSEERTEIDNNILNGAGQSIEETFSVYEVLSLFNSFCYLNGRFPTATGHTFVPQGEAPQEAGGEKLSLKKLCEKYRGSNSHALVSSQFLAALNIFFSGREENASQKSIKV